MKKRIVLGFSAAIVVVVLLLVGSSLGAYVRAQVEKREAGAIACGDSVSCSRTDQVMKVVNTGTGHGILGKTTSTKTTKAAVIGNATKKARGVYGKSKNGVGVFGESTSSNAIKGVTDSSSLGKAGVRGKNSTSGNYGYLGSKAYGVYGYSNSGTGVYGKHSCGNWGSLGSAFEGMYASSKTGAGVIGQSTSSCGVIGISSSGIGVGANSSSGNIFEGTAGSNTRFKVENDGDVYIDGSYYDTGADFADMFHAVSGLEPADVLVIGPDGKLARSSQPYSTSVAGVYSTKPGFVGGQGMDEDTTSKAPLAIVGIVPVKASAENGSICPGDLLTTSSTPGHAMKATEMRVGTLIGKALESLESGTGTIKMLVTLQ